MSQSEQTLGAFFDQLGSKRLFHSNDPSYYQRLRHQVRDALFNLLVHRRPELETTRGLQWPYEELKRHSGYLEKTLRAEHGGFSGLQARLFLALLPFPNQWHHLFEMERDMGDHPEIAEYTAREAKRITAKLNKKKQKTFKLRHFCQILKSPRMPGEKGVLRIFSLPYLFSHRPLLKDLSRDYFLYVEPPWGVLARHAWLRVFSWLEDPVLFGAAGKEDAEFLTTQPNILTTRLAHADFLPDDDDAPIQADKRFDILFNATFDDIPRKRHLFVLDLLNKPELTHVSALLIGRGEEKNVHQIRSEIKKRNLENRVTVKANIRRLEVPPWIARCRMGLQVSLHENGPRSIHEYFRAGLPCAATSSMAGVNFDLFTQQTGQVACDAEMPGLVCHMLEHLHDYTPRKWFLTQSGSTLSSRRLNEKLKDIFSAIGYEWHDDIVPLGSSGPNRYTNKKDYRRFKPYFSELLRHFQSHALPIRLDSLS